MVEVFRFSKAIGCRPHSSSVMESVPKSRFHDSFSPGEAIGVLPHQQNKQPHGHCPWGSVRYGIYSTTASYWMELTTPSSMMMVRVEVVPAMM